MRKGKTYMVAAALLVAILGVMAFAAGCGDDTPSDEESSPAAELEGTPAERAEAILGHAPTGLAKAIVDKGTVVVANDANYAPQSSIDKATGVITWDPKQRKDLTKRYTIEVVATLPKGATASGKFVISSFVP